MSDEAKTEATPKDAAAPAAEASAVKTSTAQKLAPKVKQAIEFTKTHPLGAVATVAAAAALVEVEFAVGILTGLGATALLVTDSGPQTREKFVSSGKRALSSGKLAFAKARGAFTRKPKADATAAAPQPTPAAPPPS
jgi:hypothetical protein